MPDPGDELIARVAGDANRDWFFWSGRESVRELERTLAIAGRSLSSFESVLDFGCGCGRMLLWLAELGRTTTLHGTDIDELAIGWCREHISYASFTVNEADPPLPYEDAAFDLVFNHSVFTHIDEHRQDLWLDELHRVTRPGALLVLSAHGERALPSEAWEIRDRLERDGIAHVARRLAGDAALPDWYQTTYHAPWYLFEHWGRWFEVRGYVPGGALGFQDHVLLERTDDAAGARAPLSARPRGRRERSPETRVAAALQTVRRYRDSPAVAMRPSRLRPLRHWARRLVLRAIRPYSVHEDQFDAAVVTSIDELARATDEHARALKAIERRLDERA